MNKNKINNNKNNNNIDNTDNNKGNNNIINNNIDNNTDNNNNTIITCKFCGKSHYKKYGFLGNKQKYKCKECGKVFVIGDNREKYSYDKKLKVIRMYLEGVGIRKRVLCVGKLDACIKVWQLMPAVCRRRLQIYLKKRPKILDMDCYWQKQE